MPRREKNKFDDCITVRVKRFDKTFFILADEYEKVGDMAARMLKILDQVNFRFKDQENDFEVKDVQFYIEKRSLDNESSLHD